MSDIVERLRDSASNPAIWQLTQEAADELERGRAYIDHLRAELDNHALLVEKLERQDAEIERLLKIEATARNLVAVKGRHHSEIAYKRLCAALGDEP